MDSQAFWDSLTDDLKLQSPCYVRVLRVLVEIRDGITELAGGRESSAVLDAIDIDFIKRQVEMGAYEWNDFKRLVESVAGIIRRVQSPIRDVEFRSSWAVVEASMTESDVDQFDLPRTLCKAIEFLLDRINMLRIDAANSRYFCLF